MLGTLVSVVNGAKSVLYYSFYCSVKIGQFLVSNISTILEQVANVFATIFTLFSIIWESLSVFLQDVGLGVQQFSFAVLQVIETLFGVITKVVTKAYYALDTTVFTINNFITFIINVFYAIFSGIAEVCFFIKRLVLLFGSGVWFLVTLVPLFIVYMCSLVIYYFGRMFEEVNQIISGGILGLKNVFINAVTFFTDIPLECLAGLVIAGSLFYIFTQFYLTISTFFYQKLRQILTRLSYTLQSRRTVYRHAIPRNNSPNILRARPPINEANNSVIRSRQVTVSNRQTKTVKITKTNGTDSSESKNCVVCLERVKCVLLLPCCHLCMCVECSSELQYYNNVCPICRSDIENTMKIFV